MSRDSANSLNAVVKNTGECKNYRKNIRFALISWENTVRENNKVQSMIASIAWVILLIKY